MSCERARELIIDALVEPLAADIAAELHKHIDGCGKCATEAARYASLWRDLGAAATPRPSSDALERLSRSAREEIGGNTGRPSRGWAAALRRAAGIVLLVGVGALLAIGLDALRKPTDSSFREGGRYLLVLTKTRQAPELTARFQREMGSWMASLRQQGVVESVLRIDGATPGATPPAGPLMDDDVAAFIIIRAQSLAEARSIAARSPSIRYGGSVEIRALD